MSGASLQLGRRHGEQRFYDAAKARWSRRGNHRQYQQGMQRSTSAATAGGASPALPSAFYGGKPAGEISVSPELENRLGPEEGSLKTRTVPVLSTSPVPLPCNLERFLDSTAPVVPARYPSKMKSSGRRAPDEECRPYFALADLWESFAESSAYGAGVPLVLNGKDGVIQYYVPFLSGIQLYGTSSRPYATDSRRPGEDSDGDSYRDSSSDASSDYEHEKARCSKAWDSNHVTANLNVRMDGVCSREKHHLQDGSSSDDGDLGYSQTQLLFEFLEQDPPFVREPLSDKISDLARRFPALKTLRSCDLLSSSWISVAWYPIYRIPTGPTLKDLDACFLTFHSLSLPLKDDPNISFPPAVGGASSISLPVIGLAAYKFRDSIWTPDGSGWQRVNSLLQAAEKWVRHLNIDHPDYRFFASRGAYRR